MLRGGLLAAFLLIYTSTALPWGNGGHRIAALIATSLLDENARQQVRLLLGSDDLAAVANLMDEARDSFEQRHPGASRWHYENRLVCSGESFCPRDQCVTRQIESHVRLLKNSGATREAKSEALAVIVHLLADLHQPLHLADNQDRGGNEVWVRLPGEREPKRLHEIWDTQLVRMNLQRRSNARYAKSLKQTFSANIDSWRAGTVESWAAETHQLARDMAYRTLPGFACATNRRRSSGEVPLTAEYVDSSRRIVEQQLAKAGFRLAAVLNAALN